MTAQSGTATASLFNLRVERNFRGLFIGDRGKATVRQCVASGNSGNNLVRGNTNNRQGGALTPIQGL